MKLAIVLTGVLALAGLALAQGPMTVPGSLFSPAAGKGFIVSRVAMAKGDLLTIVISEATNASTTSTTTAAKQDTTTIQQSVLPVINAITGGFAKGIVNGLLGGASTGDTSKNSGNGTSSTVTNFTSTVTVQVKDVLANGNLVVEGRRTIKMNKQNQDILLLGTVRHDDIQPDNTIPSSKVADLRLVAEGKGLIADRQREGLLTKILSWLF